MGLAKISFMGVANKDISTISSLKLVKFMPDLIKYPFMEFIKFYLGLLPWSRKSVPSVFRSTGRGIIVSTNPCNV